MSELPQGWVTSTVLELTEYVTSGSREWSKFYADEGALFIRTQDIKTNALCDQEHIARVSLPEKVEGKRTLVRPNDLLVTITGANVGKVAIVPENIPEAYVSQSVALVRPTNPGLTDYLHNCLMAPTENGKTSLQNAAYGQGRPVLSLGDVRNTEIPLPPLPEQRRIVSKLDTLSARTSTAHNHLSAIATLVEKYKAGFVTVIFEDLSEQFGEIELGSVCERITKGSSPKWQGFEYSDEGAIFVRSQNVLWGKLNLSDVTRLPAEFNEKQRNSVMERHDVLLNIVGASIGRSAVVPSELVGANCNQAVAVIRLLEPSLEDASYLSQWLISPTAQAQITENAVDVARANFSLGQAKKLSIPWATEDVRKATVLKIEAAFAKIDRLAAEAEKALKLTDRLDQRILAKAFAGELVPQDPTDEPASVLLDRIRAERASAPKPKRGRRKKADAAT